MNALSVSIRFLVAVLLLPAVAWSQPVSVLNKPLDAALRRAQLWGDVPVTTSFCVRPVQAARALGFTNPYGPDSLYDFMAVQDSLPTHLLPHYSYDADLSAFKLGYQKDFVRFQAVPLSMRAQFNSHHDYGWQDGPMIPNKGLQTYFNAGLYGKIGPLEFQYAPEWVNAANEDLPAPGVRNSNNGNDTPDRFGTEPYRRSYLGQSFVKLHAGPLAMGLSSENVYWGPGRFAGIVMTDNAPGMRHLTIESSKPLRTKWGTLEGQFFTGNKMRSGFNYLRGPNPNGSSLPEVIRNPAMDTVFSVFTAAVGVWNPAWFPGMSLGITREIWTEGPVSTDSSPWDYVALFYSNPFRGSGGGTQASIDQMASVFFRYVLPESHAEVYGEYGFDDNRYDIEDLIVSPDHSRAYIIGFSKLSPIKGKEEYLEFNYELAQFEMSKESYNRYRTPFYDSDYSHFGQLIGSGVGTGSNQLMLSGIYSKNNRRIGLTYERVARNNDLLYLGYVPWVATWYGFDFTKKYIESSLGVNYEKRFGPVLIWAKALLTQTYNWNYWYDPAGTGSPMRANGYNLKSLNVFSGMTLLL